MADLARRVELANCTCKDTSGVTLAIPGQPEEFEAEMNLPCPAHGVRRLGRIMQLRFVEPGVTGKPDARLDELIATYQARLDQANREHAYAPPEF
jgi:hypothetical protein